MDEILKRDQNHVTVLAGVTDDADQDIMMLRVDPTTKRLLVKATGGGGGSLTVKDIDGTPTVTNVNTINFPNGSVTDDGGGEVTVAISSSSVSWGNIIGTLSDQTDLQTALNAKQATLVSGTNIKTINGSSILGSGNLSIAPTLDDILTNGNTSANTIFITDGVSLETAIDTGVVSVTDFTETLMLIPNELRYSNGTNIASLVYETLTANRTHTLPNESGTVALTSDLTSKAGTSQVFDWPPLLYGTVTNGDYKIIIDCSFGGTINEVTTQSTAGTGTFTVKINTTPLGGTANSVSTTKQTQTHSSANTFVAGDDIVITCSSASALQNVSVKIKYTRTLS